MKAKRAFQAIIGFLMVFMTLMSARAIDIDTIEDKFVVSAGDSVQGAFIVTDYQDPITLESNLEWVSFHPSLVVTEDDDPTGTLIAKGVKSFKYYITVPEDADIGVYRSTVKAISVNGEAKYLNIKISVQNRLISWFNEVFSIWYVPYIAYLTVFLLILAFTVSVSRK